MECNEILARLNFIKEESITLGILVIGNELFTKELGDKFRKCHNRSSNKYKLYLVSCVNIKEVLYQTSFLHIDYVIFLLDTRLKSYATDVEFNLERMDRSFLCGRTCVVNINPHIPLSDTNKLNSFRAFKEKYGVTILNGNVMNPAACANLAQRLLILIETNLGIKSKSPFIPWLLQREINT